MLGTKAAVNVKIDANVKEAANLLSRMGIDQTTGNIYVLPKKHSGKRTAASAGTVAVKRGASA